GASALAYHLSPDGYELGSSLPEGEAAAVKRWGALRDALLPRATTGVALLPNGADHHALQRHLPAALAALARVAEPIADLRRTSLAEFAAALESASAEVELPVVSNDAGGGVELRNSYGYTWTLQGTLGARAALKRRNARVERLFLREMEPWVALASLSTRRSARGALVRAAWKTLLLCHPHDTLCGCSIDEVARAMAARLDDACAQGAGLRDDAILDIVRHDSLVARSSSDSWQPIVLVRNAAARRRGGVAELDVLRLREHVRVGPGSAPERLVGNDVASAASDSSPYSLAAGRVPCQLLHRSVRHDRVESPLAYPHDDLVDSDRVLAWIAPVAGYGTRALTIGEARHDHAAAPPELELPMPVRVGDAWLDNGLLRVEVDASGAIRLESADGNFVQESLIAFEDVGDAGDLYTHSPVGPVVVHAHFLGARLVHSGPLRGEVHASWRLDVPVESTRAGRSSVTREVEMNAALTLDTDAPFLRIRIWGENRCRDHRLRVVFRSGMAAPEVWADAAFGAVRRTPVVAPESSAELPPSTAPLARYVTLSDVDRGVTLYSDGMAEYEAAASGDIAVTLVRAVGELSRNDLPERPGHAGWPVATPDAQSIGGFEAHFAILPHGPRDLQRIALIERVADDVLLPLRGSTLRSALSLPAPTAGVELIVHESDAPDIDGCLALSACKITEDGAALLLRCVNLTDRTIHALWRSGTAISGASLARLDETPTTPLAIHGNEVPFEAAPHAVVTVIVRGPSLAE
ncbi:MAG TPA: glycoside hydrolase family 38 C-terminal domain-containing protein, partial [Gemmatimonadaceae bacterium]